MEPAWGQLEALYRAYLLTNSRSRSTASSYIYNVRLFARWCTGNGICATSPTADDVRLYISELQDELAANTVPLRLSCLRAFFAFCKDRGLCTANPTEGLSVKRQRLLPRRPFTTSEVCRLLDACTSDRDRAMITVTFAAGLRVSELIGLRSSDVDLHEGTIRVRGKGGKERLLTPGLTALKALLPFLGGARGILWWTERRTPVTVERAKVNMARLGQRAGIPSAHWHRLRTTFANEALASGVLLEDLQVLMGHSHISTTSHYAGHTINRRALEHMRRLNLGDKLGVVSA